MRPISVLLNRVLDAAHGGRIDSIPSSPNGVNKKDILNHDDIPRLEPSDEPELADLTPREISSSSMHVHSPAHKKGGEHRSNRDQRRFSTTSFNFNDDEKGPTSNLELTLEYDCNQTLPPFAQCHSHQQIGPLAYLFRWYTKRATLFSPGFPRPEDIPDAPLLPSDNLNPSAPSSHHQQTPSASATQETAAGSPRAAHGHTNATSGTSSKSRRPSYSSWDEGLPPHGGRSLNRAPDPVMNLQELELMLEDLDVVPGIVSRHDVSQAFAASHASVSHPPLPGQLPLAQIRPDEIRFPQFQDCLVRIALMAWALDESSLSQQSEKHSSAVNAVRVLTERIGANHSSIMLLKRRLDSLARTVSERSAKKSINKLSHVSSGSGVEAAKRVMSRLRSEGSWPSDLTPADWKIDDPNPPPHLLLAQLMSADEAAKRRYRPDWKLMPAHESGEPVLEVGHMKVGEVRSFRILLRNRGANTMHLRVDTLGSSSNASSSSSSGLACSFSELPMPPGVPRVLHVETTWEEPGHYAGVIRIRSFVKREGYQCNNTISWSVTVV